MAKAKTSPDDTVDLPGTKFQVGDRVVLKDGRRGEVTEVPLLAPAFLKDNEQFYTVRLEPWTPEEFRDENDNPAVRFRHPEDEPGGLARYRAHEVDVLGCVTESLLSRGK